MDRELWKQVDALLEQALEQPPKTEAFVVSARRTMQCCAMKC
jgi:hypothetical protein